MTMAIHPQEHPKFNKEAKRLFDFLASLTQGEELAAQMRRYLVDHIGQLSLLLSEPQTLLPEEPDGTPQAAKWTPRLVGNVDD